MVDENELDIVRPRKTWFECVVKDNLRRRVREERLYNLIGLSGGRLFIGSA